MSHNPSLFVGERVRDSNYGALPEHPEDIAREPSPSISDITDGVSGNISRSASRPVSSMSDAAQAATAEEPSAEKERGPQVSVSKWTVGWRIPTGMILSYILALAIAITHLLFFEYLKGKRTDGPSSHVPQSYVTTASTIMANILGLLLQLSLAMAFTQCLWRLVRFSSFKTVTIDRFFTMRTNLVSLFGVILQREAWILVLVSILIWAIPIAVSFPPGAMTVVPKIHPNLISNGKVPTFAASDLGDGTFDYVTSHSLTSFASLGDSQHIIAQLSGGYSSMSFPANPSLQRLTQRTMLNGAMGTLPSPCGANCSYTLQFQGPYFQCSNNNRNLTLLYNNTSSEADLNTTVYSSVWTNFASNLLSSVDQKAVETSARLNFTTLRANTLAYNPGNTNFKLNVTQNDLSCIPSRAGYEVEIVYNNSVQNIQISATSVHPLMNLENGVFWPTDPSSSSKSKSKRQFPSNPVWTGPYTISQTNTSQVGYIRDSNLMAVMQAMAIPLTGWFQADFEQPNIETTPIKTDPDGYKWINAAWIVAQIGDHGGPYNGTIASNTPLYTYFDSFGMDQYAGITPTLFDVNQDVLNAMLANITLSSIAAFNLWTTNTDITQNLSVNVYSFSRPLNLLLPYFLILSLALPFVVLGLYSLHANGVSATDGGFLQLLTTTRGSKVIDEAAKGGCLGGDENVPDELKKIKVRFGELIHEDSSSGSRLAGFGTEDEVVTLRKGERYGG